MAKKRMFNQEVVRSDEFLDLPQSSQLLYFHFGMIADDDGIVASVERELRYLGFGTRDDLKILLDKSFIDFTTDGKLVFIIHWLKNNNLRVDRYSQTTFKEARKELEAKGYQFKNKTFGTTSGIPKDTQGAATDKEKEEGIDKGKGKGKGIEEDVDSDTDSLLSDYFNTFTNLAIKNNKLREAVKIEFIKLPTFQKEQAVTGAKNYSVWYKREKIDDPTGKFSVNAVKFIIGDKETFDDFQTLPTSEPQNRKTGGYI